MLSRKIVAGVLGLAAWISPLGVLASSHSSPESWINGILTRFLSMIVWPIFAAVIVLMFIYAGYLFVTAAGDGGKVDTAKKTAIWAVAGIVVGIFAYSAYGIIGGIITG